jgi:UDP-2,3-diacylglucosamine pyrophosphatase LpxH
MMSDWFCNRCSLQFDKKYVFDLHLLLVHGDKMEVKKETFTICEEKVLEPKICEKELSNQKVEKHPKCDRCNSVFKTKQT